MAWHAGGQDFESPQPGHPQPGHPQPRPALQVIGDRDVVAASPFEKVILLSGPSLLGSILITMANTLRILK